MSNKTTVFLLGLVIAAMTVLFSLNIAGLYLKAEPEKFLSRNNIRGMAVEHLGKQYTLNFEQQNKVVSIINRSIKIGLEGSLLGEDITFGYDYLIIYRFKGDDIKIKPIAFANLQLIFQAKELYPQGLLRETGPGELHQLLSKAYDTNQK